MTEAHELNPLAEMSSRAVRSLGDTVASLPPDARCACAPSGIASPIDANTTTHP